MDEAGHRISEPVASPPAAVVPPLCATEPPPSAYPPNLVNPPPLAPSAEERRQQWELEFRDVQRLAVFYGAMLLPILALTGYAFHTGSARVELEFAGGAILYAVIAGFAFAWRHEWIALLRWPVERSRRWVALTAAVPLCSIPAAYVMGRWAEIWGWPVNDLTTDFLDGGYPAWLAFIWVAVLPPVFEEIAFRGMLLAKLQRLMHSTQAIWVCAVLFGVVHFSLVSMAVFLVPVAVAAGYLTRQTRSLLPAIALHAAHNGGMVAIELLGW